MLSRCLMLLAAGAALALGGCAAVQVRENTLQMVDSVSRIRDVQVLRNLSAAINDHDMVPTQILLTTGQASVSADAGASASFPRFRLFDGKGELDLSTGGEWTAQWQVSPVTNADDLRRLRNLYVLIVSTDQQYDDLEAYFDRNPQQKADSACYGFQSTASAAAPVAADGSGGCPPGYGSGQIPKWKQALVVIESGDSIGCKLYQEAFATARARIPHDDRRGVPFRRWLYWRRAGGAWLPTAPQAEPQSLGRFGGWELATTSRACFDDFVILAQSATPETAAAGGGGARVMLSH